MVPLRRYVLSACDGPFGSAIATEHYVDSGARVIRLGNIGPAQWRDADRVYIDPAYWRSLSRHHATSGDLVVAALGDENNPVGRAAVVPDLGAALVKADCHRLRLNRADADPQFLAYYLSSRLGQTEAWRLADGATRQRLTLGKTLSLRVPVVSVNEQRVIVDYLDRETARIDALIEAKHAIIDRLYERCDALILLRIGQSALVRNGDATAVPLRRVLVKRRSFAPIGTPIVTAYRDGQVTLRSRRRPEGYTEAAPDAAMQEVQLGDVVIHGLDGFAGAIGTAEASGASSPVYHVCRTLDGGDPHYWGRMLRVLAVSGYLELFVTSTRERAYDMRNWEVMGRIPVPRVSLEEQHHIGESLRRIPPLRSVFERSIALLRERRQATITKAVSGDIEPAEEA